ncbi:zinc finger protein 92 homolog [Suricata suricatta]|uniref:zinc finger protein 92 homolog n=1 Tax=Suricata suricatta TaxID=37032 RepID=UPI0011554325|nr:zinc finger protein 92 homolog [Suricata suricatta]
MAAILLKTRPKVLVSFEDVSMYFTKTEWKLLDLRQRILYKTVMLENYRHLVSLGFLASKPHLVSWLEQGEGCQAADIHRTRAAAGLQTGDRVKSGTSISKQKHCPKELTRTDFQAGDKSHIAGPPGETLDRTGKHASPPQTGSSRGDQPRERGQSVSSGEGRELGQRGDNSIRQDSGLRPQRSVGNEKQYPCQQCGKAFAHSSNLIEHRVIHSGERPHACGQHGKAFMHSSNLIEHQRTHSGERPYACGQCLKAFKGVSQLIHHQRVHSGEKPFACRECGKAFRGRSGLSQRGQVHSGEKPYECSECVKAFGRCSNLFKHQVTHGGGEERPCGCPDCGTVFQSRSSLLEHRCAHGAMEARSPACAARPARGKCGSATSAEPAVQGSPWREVTGERRLPLCTQGQECPGTVPTHSDPPSSLPPLVWKRARFNAWGLALPSLWSLLMQLKHRDLRVEPRADSYSVLELPRVPLPYNGQHWAGEQDLVLGAVASSEGQVVPFLSWNHSLCPKTSWRFQVEALKAL